MKAIVHLLKQENLHFGKYVVSVPNKKYLPSLKYCSYTASSATSHEFPGSNSSVSRESQVTAVNTRDLERIANSSLS